VTPEKKLNSKNGIIGMIEI